MWLFSMKLNIYVIVFATQKVPPVSLCKAATSNSNAKKSHTKPASSAYTARPFTIPTSSSSRDDESHSSDRVSYVLDT